MFRRSLTLHASICLLICVVVTVAWIASEWRAYGISRHSVQRTGDIERYSTLLIASDRGHLFIGWRTVDAPFDPALDPSLLPANSAKWTRARFPANSFADIPALHAQQYVLFVTHIVYGSQSHPYSLLSIPCWLLLAIFAICPALWLRRRWRESHRTKPANDGGDGGANSTSAKS